MTPRTSLACLLLCLTVSCTKMPINGRAPLCISGPRIDHTEVVDDNTILFHMTDRSVYQNRLTSPCVGLKQDTRGFTYEPTDPGTQDLCSNLLTIQLNTFHATCLLGEFTLIKPPPGAR